MKSSAAVSVLAFADAALAAGVSASPALYFAKIVNAGGTQVAAWSGPTPTVPAFNAAALPNGTYVLSLARMGSDGYPIGTPAMKTFVLDEQTVSIPSEIDVVLS